MKKTILKAAVISVLICSALLLGSQSVMVAGEPVPRTAYYPGDTYTTLYLPTEIPPPNGTKQPIITITSPANWSVTASNNLTLTFNLTLEASTSHYPITLDALYYKPSWQPDNRSLEIDSKTPFMKRTFPFTVNIPNVPNGTRTITIYACTVCEYETSRELVRQPVSQSGFIIGNFLYIYSSFYRAAGSSSVAFTVDPSAHEETTPPTEPPARGIPMIFLIAAGISIALTAAIASLFLYFKKRKRQFQTGKTTTALWELLCNFVLLFVRAFLSCCSSLVPHGPRLLRVRFPACGCAASPRTACGQRWLQRGFSYGAEPQTRKQTFSSCQSAQE